MARRLAVGVGAAVLLFGAAAGEAHGAYDPVVSGRTALRFDPQFLSLLKRNGVQVRGRQGASFRRGVLSFPVTGGRFDPTTQEGTVEHGGSAVFAGGDASLPLKDLQLKTTRRSAPLAIRLGGGQLKLGRARSLAVGRDGFGDRIAVSKIALSAKVATRLSKRLHLRGVFQEGMQVGSAVTRAQPETATVEGTGRVSFDLDPGIAAKLNDLHVAVNPIFPAEHPGSFTLPIFGGKLAPDLASGRLETQGALEFLQLGGGTVTWSDSALDLDAAALIPAVEVQPAPPYPGKLGEIAVAALGLPAASRSADPRRRTLSVNGATLALSAAAAASFNEAFARPLGKADVFEAGEPLATLAFLAETQ
jgi:hypothetical protein